MTRRPSATSVARRPPGAVEAQQAVVALLRTADAVRAVLEEVIGQYGITGQQYNVLRILRGAGPEGLPTLSVADRLIERAPGITRLLDRLVRQKLVVRTRPPDDRRCVCCRLTSKGRDLLERLDEPVSMANRDAVAALDDSTLKRLTALLERIRQAHDTGDAATEEP